MIPGAIRGQCKNTWSVKIFGWVNVEQYKLMLFSDGDQF